MVNQVSLFPKSFLFCHHPSGMNGLDKQTFPAQPVPSFSGNKLGDVVFPVAMYGYES